MGGKRRRGLADLIGEVGGASQEQEGGEQGRNSTATDRREDVREGRPESGGGAGVRPVAREQGRDEAVTPAPRTPKYLRLERKEARLRGDQVDALSALVKRVNRRKASPGGERITENTLIRVAVDWLLSQEEYVGGSTEEEIGRGLGLPGSGAQSGPV